MDFIIKDQNVRPIAVIDLYTSAIWTERYSDIGVFELYLPLNSSYLEYLAIDNYVTLQDSDRAMIIESMQVESRVDSGEKIVLYKGSSLESVLKRRIVWNQTTLSGKADVIVQSLLNQNAIAPSNAKRRIPKLVYGGAFDAETAEYISAVSSIECQFTGETLFDAIKSICEKINLGFKIVFDDAGQMVFYLYYGTDRTLGQTERDAIVFSPEYDTLISSRYLQNFASYRNVALVDGEEAENNTRKRESVYISAIEPSGLDRREMYVNASDLRSDDGGRQMSDADYRKLLQYKGIISLQENHVTTAFDGEVETNIGPQFNRDYFLGDFVSTKNEYGLGTVAQITEYIRSYDAGGYSAYPSCVMIN